jgi:hypothetical protein
MRFKSELTIPAACRIVGSGHEQWQQTGSIEPEQLARVRKVQIEIAQYLARFEDGPDVLFMTWSTLEEIASDLICLSEQSATSCATGAETASI